MKRKVTGFGLCLGIVLLSGCVSSRQTTSQKPVAIRENQAILSKLSEIVALRERSVENRLVEFRRGDAEYPSAQYLALAEARLALAQSSGEKEAAMAALKEIVALAQTRWQRTQAAALDRYSTADLEEAQAALLMAELRLMRAQQ